MDTTNRAKHHKLIPKVEMQGDAQFTTTYKVANGKMLSAAEDLGDAAVSVTIDEGSTFNMDMQNVSFQTDDGTVLICYRDVL